MLTETEEKELEKIETEIENLIKKGTNDESLVSKKKILINKKYGPSL